MDIRAAQTRTLGDDRCRLLLAQREALRELAHERRIHLKTVRLRIFPESPDKGFGKDFFSLDLAARHVKSHGEGAVPMTLEDVSLALLHGSLGGLCNSDGRRF